jgi:hypothetical protein
MTEVTEMIKEYERQVPVKDLAQRFGIHRLTVTALLRRRGVELRRTGLTPEDILLAASLYGQGWSLARLGTRYGVDSTSVWRALRAAGGDAVAKPSPLDRCSNSARQMLLSPSMNLLQLHNRPRRAASYGSISGSCGDRLVLQRRTGERIVALAS